MGELCGFRGGGDPWERDGVEFSKCTAGGDQGGVGCVVGVGDGWLGWVRVWVWGLGILGSGVGAHVVGGEGEDGWLAWWLHGLLWCRWWGETPGVDGNGLWWWLLREWWWVGLSWRLGVWWVGVGSVWLQRWVGRSKMAGIGLGCGRGWWIVGGSNVGVCRGLVGLLEGPNEVRVLTLLKGDERSCRGVVGEWRGWGIVWRWSSW